MRAVIDRDEVLHVARLARLRLSEDEIEPMARELSAVLDHIATIEELDLDDVLPTTHVVADAMPSGPACARTSHGTRCRVRSRWPRRPRLALTAKASWSQALKHDLAFFSARMVPAKMSDAEIIDLSAAEAAREIAAGELAAGEVFEAYRARAAKHTSQAGLNCFTWVAPEGSPAPSLAEMSLRVPRQGLCTGCHWR